MMKLQFDLTSGRAFIDENPLSFMDENDFQNSNIYQYLKENHNIEKKIPRHYTIKSIIWMDKEFEMILRPFFSKTFPFMIQLIDKSGDYYSCIHDWDKVANTEMLNKEIEILAEWLRQKIILKSPFENKYHQVSWAFDWGCISAQYEVKSFNCGIYITWNN